MLAISGFLLHGDALKVGHAMAMELAEELCACHLFVDASRTLGAQSIIVDDAPNPLFACDDGQLGKSGRAMERGGKRPTAERRRVDELYNALDSWVSTIVKHRHQEVQEAEEGSSGIVSEEARRGGGEKKRGGAVRSPLLLPGLNLRVTRPSKINAMLRLKAAEDGNTQQLTERTVGRTASSERPNWLQIYEDAIAQNRKPRETIWGADGIQTRGRGRSFSPTRRGKWSASPSPTRRSTSHSPQRRMTRERWL